MIPIIHSDEDLLAVEKPEGLASIPERGGNLDCLLFRLQDELSQKLYVVHRLDKEVSGIILFARHAAAHRWLSMAFEQRQIEKRYLALIHGKMPEMAGEMNQPLRQFGSGRMGVDVRNGKPSLTSYRVRKNYSAFSLVDAYPRSGRRHQIRVHFYACGHAIVGDLRYGDAPQQSKYSRLMLHAEQITFTALSGRVLCLTCPPTASFTSLLQQLCGDE